MVICVGCKGTIWWATFGCLFYTIFLQTHSWSKGDLPRHRGCWSWLLQEFEMDARGKWKLLCSPLLISFLALRFLPLASVYFLFDDQHFLVILFRMMWVKYLTWHSAWMLMKKSTSFMRKLRYFKYIKYFISLVYACVFMANKRLIFSWNVEFLLKFYVVWSLYLFALFAWRRLLIMSLNLEEEI